MERYEEYKDTGVEWIGEIPVGWKIKKLCYCFDNIGSGITPTSGEADYYFNGSINWLQTGDLNDGEIISTSKKITKKAVSDYSALRMYPTGSLIIAMYGATIGKVGLLKIPSTTNQACCVLAGANSVVSKFAFYWLISIRDHIISLAYGGGQPNINQEMIRSLKIQLPSLNEQTAIANFLDRKTMEIDELITQKERLLELYKEERTAIINHAVTKGLNPDSRMRDSGIEGLGKIPAHWEIQQVRQIGILQKCKGGTKADELPEGIPCIRYGDLYTHHRFFIRQSRSYVSPERASYYTPIQYGDVLFAASGETIDEIGKSAVNLINEYACCGGDVILLRIKVKANAQFVGYATGSTYAAFQKARMGCGITVMHIYTDQLKHLSIARPPLSEQTAIANFLDLKTAEIDAKVAKIQRIIELQKEYRTTLISEVVTGKIKTSHMAGEEIK